MSRAVSRVRAATRRVPAGGLIGSFVNLLPLRIRLDATMAFGELLAHVQDVAFEAYVHLGLPFGQLVDHLALDRSKGPALRGPPTDTAAVMDWQPWTR